MAQIECQCDALRKTQMNPIELLRTFGLVLNSIVNDGNVLCWQQNCMNECAREVGTSVECVLMQAHTYTRAFIQLNFYHPVWDTPWRFVACPLPSGTLIEDFASVNIVFC